MVLNLTKLNNQKYSDDQVKSFLDLIENLSGSLKDVAIRDKSIDKIISIENKAIQEARLEKYKKKYLK